MTTAERRHEYVTWVADRFGALEPDMAPTDGRRWALSQARLVLDRDVAKANRYLESFELTADADICFIRFLKTLLDFTPPCVPPLPWPSLPSYQTAGGRPTCR